MLKHYIHATLSNAMWTHVDVTMTNGFIHATYTSFSHDSTDSTTTNYILFYDTNGFHSCQKYLPLMISWIEFLMWTSADI